MLRAAGANGPWFDRMCFDAASKTSPKSENAVVFGAALFN